ncbi:hypothetical protein JT358_09480 [Micrococcales bacterium 31B]|nr:hypothetical protein [Micrococcales bacterium 31B]
MVKRMIATGTGIEHHGRGRSTHRYGSVDVSRVLPRVAALLAAFLLGVVMLLMPAAAEAKSVAGASEPRTASAPSEAGATPPRIAMTKCAAGGPDSLECGQLITSEQRRNADSRTVAVPWVRHRVPVKGEPNPPVVYVAPSGTAVREAGRMLATGLFADRDLIVVETRGGPTGDDALVCGTAPAAQLALLQANQAEPAARAAAMTTYATALKGCTDAYVADEHVLQGIAVIESAADVAELRTLLSIPTWYAMGSDWSSIVALQAAVYDTQGIVGVIADGYASQNLQSQRNAGLQAAAQDLEARAGAEAVDFDALVKAYNAEPLTVTSTNPLTGAPLSWRVDGFDLAMLFQQALRDSSVNPYAEVWLRQARDRDAEALDVLVQRALPGVLSNATAASWVYTCRLAPGEVSTTWLFNDADVKQVCNALQVGVEGTVPVPAQPIVALFGTGNPLASPRLGTEALAAAPAAQELTFATGGADLLATSSCARTVLTTWMKAPAMAVAAPACAKAATAVKTSDQVIAAPRFAPQLALGTFQVWSVLLIPLLFAVIAPVWTLAWAGGLAASLVRRRGRVAALLAGVAPVFSLLSIAGIAWVVWRLYRTNDSVFLVGAPHGVVWGGLCLIPALVGVGALFYLRRWFDAILAAIAVLAYAGWFAWAVLGWG